MYQPNRPFENRVGQLGFSFWFHLLYKIYELFILTELKKSQNDRLTIAMIVDFDRNFTFKLLYELKFSRWFYFSPNFAESNPLAKISTSIYVYL